MGVLRRARFWPLLLVAIVSTLAPSPAQSVTRSIVDVVPQGAIWGKPSSCAIVAASPARVSVKYGQPFSYDIYVQNVSSKELDVPATPLVQMAAFDESGTYVPSTTKFVHYLGMDRDTQFQPRQILHESFSVLKGYRFPSVGNYSLVFTFPCGKESATVTVRADIF